MFYCCTLRSHIFIALSILICRSCPNFALEHHVMQYFLPALKPHQCIEIKDFLLSYVCFELHCTGIWGSFTCTLTYYMQTVVVKEGCCPTGGRGLKLAVPKTSLMFTRLPLAPGSDWNKELWLGEALVFGTGKQKLTGCDVLLGTALPADKYRNMSTWPDLMQVI